MRQSRTYAALALAVIGVLCCLISEAKADPIPGLFNTGVDDSGVPLAFGVVDSHYTIVVPAGFGDAFVIDETVGSPPFPPAAPEWVPDSPTSRWISHSEPPLDGGGVMYFYSLTFDLTGLDPATASISGSWAVDDLAPLGSGIFLNGVFTGNLNLAGPDVLTAFTIPVGGPFVPADNELEFVLMTLEAGFEGLRVDGMSGAADPLPPAMPQPASVTLWGLGFAGLLAAAVAGKRARALRTFLWGLASRTDTEQDGRKVGWTRQKDTRNGG